MQDIITTNTAQQVSQIVSCVLLVNIQVLLVYTLAPPALSGNSPIQLVIPNAMIVPHLASPDTFLFQAHRFALSVQPDTTSQPIMRRIVYLVLQVTRRCQECHTVLRAHRVNIRTQRLIYFLAQVVYLVTIRVVLLLLRAYCVLLASQAHLEQVIAVLVQLCRRLFNQLNLHMHHHLPLQL